MMCIDMSELPEINKKDDIPIFVKALESKLSQGLIDKGFVGSCLYVYATDFCMNASIELPLRIAFQEYLFDNYRVNGILDTKYIIECSNAR